MLIRSVPTIYHGLPGFILSLGVSIATQDMMTIFMIFYIYALMFTHYINSPTSSLVFSMHLWLLCSWSRACCCTLFLHDDPFVLHGDPIYHGEFGTEIQLCLMSSFTSSAPVDQPLMMHSFSSCKCKSFCVVSCMSCNDIYVGTSVVPLMPSMFGFIPSIYLFFFMILSGQPVSYLEVVTWYL